MANWIKGAVKHPGAFTAAAKKAGKSVSDYATEKKDAPGVLGKRARLAQTFEKMAGKRKSAGAKMYPSAKE